mgnify:CR=1 FL=1
MLLMTTLCATTTAQSSRRVFLLFNHALTSCREQFLYGEDGIDVGKAAHLDKFSFLTSNADGSLFMISAQQI